MKQHTHTYTEASWEVPPHTPTVFRQKQSRYALVIPVLNEGERIKSMLVKLQEFADQIDIIIADKGSTDGSTHPDALIASRVRTLLTLNDPAGRLSAQLRMAYAYILREGYAGVVTIDGNDKDDVPALPRFMELLDQGYDFIQASRYIKGGEGVHTPLVRDLAIRMVHTPLISLLSGFRYTDTTQGYRAYSRALLMDPDIRIFRKIFATYELLAYLSVQAPRHGYRVVETPVTRTYPKGKKIPTKITAIRGNLKLLGILLDLIFHRYDPH